MTGRLRAFNWSIAKTDLARITGLSDDALHVLAGMLVLTFAAFALRRPPWSWRPWLVVLLVETANELYDLFQTSFPNDEGNLHGSLHDFWLTLAWPTLILLLYPYFVGSGPVPSPLKRNTLYLIGGGAAGVIGLLCGRYFW